MERCFIATLGGLASSRSGGVHVERPWILRWLARQHDDGDKLAFDRVYEPVAAEGRLFVPSMVTDRVTAYDLATGEFQWDSATGGSNRAYVAEFRGVALEPGRPLVIEFAPGEGSARAPLACGLETRLEE